MWPDIIAGGASLLGGILQNRASAKQAQNQMDFQAQQSATSHQREVADLRAAGLNPILSGTGGMGASTPQGAQAPVVNTLGPAVSSAVDTYRARSEVRKRQQEVNINRPEEMLKLAAANALTQVEQPINKLIEKIPDIIGAATSTAYRAVDDVKGQALSFSDSMSHPHLKPGSAALGFLKDKINTSTRDNTKYREQERGWNDTIRSWFRRHGGNSAKSHQSSAPSTYKPPTFNDTGNSRDTQDFLRRYRKDNP
jgi:hypothetical protein